MSKTVYEDGNIAITERGTMFVTGAASSRAGSSPKFANPIPGEEEVSLDVAMWGTNNLLPKEMAADIENTGVLWAAIEAKARIALGKGPMPARVKGFTADGYEELEFVNDSAVMDFLEASNAFLYSFSTLKDIYGLGNAWTQFLTNPNRTRIEYLKRQDAVKCRFSKLTNDGRIEYTYLSGDWEQYADSTDKGDHFTSVPLLDRDFPLLDFQSRTKGNTFMMALQYPLQGRTYYAPSPWFSARKWVKIAQNIPAMKEALNNNAMAIKYQCDVHPDFWKEHDPKYEKGSKEERKKIREAFYAVIDAYLVGAENSGKTVWNTMIYDSKEMKHVPAIIIRPLDDKTKEGKMIIESVAANSEILLPMMINTSLLGVSMPTGSGGMGAGSGSDIRESFLVQIMLLEFERNMISRPFNLVKKVNGWDRDLVLRFPNQMLTTLNTGKNTQPTA